MVLRIEGFVWLDWVLDRLTTKHNIEPEEVEAAFFPKEPDMRRDCVQDAQILWRSN